MRDLGRYRVRSTLGSGGMATVFLASDTGLGRQVAIKLLADNLAADPAFRDRFQREAQLAARLSHPNIVHVYDIARDDDGRPYIVMEYVDGESLHETLQREGPLDPTRVTAIARDCCAGLAYAHAAGLVHRDIKPQNLLCDRNGCVKITDFGIARSMDDLAITKTGSVLGTVGYLAPEQARGEAVTPAADMFGLGVTLHQLLTGSIPDPRVLQTVAEPLRSAIERCVDVEPSMRPTADDLAAMLGEASPALAAAPTTRMLPYTSAPTRVARPARSRYAARPSLLERPRLVLAATLVLVVAGVIVLATSAWRGGSGTHTPPAAAAHHHRQASAITPPRRGATPAAQAQNLATWLRQHSG